MTNKERVSDYVFVLAQHAGFSIAQLHPAFYEKDNEFINFTRLITEKCSVIAARTPVPDNRDPELWREACVAASKQIRKEMGL